jgi:imidazolonepropionase-like amidohydrolase
MKRKELLLLGMFLLIVYSCGQGKDTTEKTADSKNPASQLWPVNEEELLKGDNIKAIVGATLIDGNGGEPLLNSTVIIQQNRILWVGKSGDYQMPEEAEVINAEGLVLMPGLIDAHFHLDRSKTLPHLFLQNGITSLRDPGAWIEAYEGERTSGYAVPRLFLTGPHFDSSPPAYPYDAFIARDVEEARIQVNKLADQGASALKVYFKLPLQIIKAVCDQAHQRGLVVTGHLETVPAVDAIRAGLDGIEHVTSLGTSLIPAREAEKYKQAMLLDSNARRSGWYEMWNNIALDGPHIDSLISLMVEKNTFLSATLAIFEFQDQQVDSVKFSGFKKMMEFIGKANKGGVNVVVGSHSVVPHAEPGWAYHREMELLAASGMTNHEVIMAATLENARFFKVEDRLGSIEVGKQADLILIAGNPLEDIKNMRNIKQVMLNGTWVNSN